MVFVTHDGDATQGIVGCEVDGSYQLETNKPLEIHIMLLHVEQISEMRLGSNTSVISSF